MISAGTRSGERLETLRSKGRSWVGSLMNLRHLACCRTPLPERRNLLQGLNPLHLLASPCSQCRCRRRLSGKRCHSLCVCSALVACCVCRHRACCPTGTDADWMAKPLLERGSMPTWVRERQHQKPGACCEMRVPQDVTKLENSQHHSQFFLLRPQCRPGRWLAVAWRRQNQLHEAPPF